MNHPLSTPRRLLLASPSADASIALLMATHSPRADDDTSPQPGAKRRSAQRCAWPVRACTCAARAGALAPVITDTTPDTSLERSNT